MAKNGCPLDETAETEVCVSVDIQCIIKIPPFAQRLKNAEIGLNLVTFHQQL